MTEQPDRAETDDLRAHLIALIERDALLRTAEDLRRRRLRSFVEGSDFEKGLHYAEAVIRAGLAHPELPAIEDDPVAVRLNLQGPAARDPGR